MSFLADPDIRVLGELDQDRALTRRSLEFVRENPSQITRAGPDQARALLEPLAQRRPVRVSQSRRRKRPRRDPNLFIDPRRCLEPAARRASPRAARRPAHLLLCGASRIRELDPLSNSRRDGGNKPGWNRFPIDRQPALAHASTRASDPPPNFGAGLLPPLPPRPIRPIRPI